MLSKLDSNPWLLAILFYQLPKQLWQQTLGTLLCVLTGVCVSVVICCVCMCMYLLCVYLLCIFIRYMCESVVVCVSVVCVFMYLCECVCIWCVCLLCMCEYLQRLEEGMGYPSAGIRGGGCELED